MLDWYWYPLLIAAGFAAGIVNTIAGGGSFLTLPALMFICGLDPKTANYTNRVAILFSSATASWTFRQHGLMDGALAKRLVIPTLVGVPLGALLAIYLPPSAFKPAFGCIFLIMAIVILRDPKRMLEGIQRREHSPRTIFLVFMGIGVYVGFAQAGMGILLLLGMSLVNTGDLVASNAIKNMIGFLVTLAATLVFAFSNLIEWIPGLVMAAGNILGGFTGAKLAIAKGNRLVFFFLIAVMLCTAIKLIFF